MIVSVPGTNKIVAVRQGGNLKLSTQQSTQSVAVSGVGAMLPLGTPSKFSTSFRNVTGSNNIDHNLGTRSVIVQVYSSSTPSTSGGNPLSLTNASISIANENRVSVSMPSDSNYYFAVVVG